MKRYIYIGELVVLVILNSAYWFSTKTDIIISHKGKLFSLWCSWRFTNSLTHSL